MQLSPRGSVQPLGLLARLTSLAEGPDVPHHLRPPVLAPDIAQCPLLAKMAKRLRNNMGVGAHRGDGITGATGTGTVPIFRTRGCTAPICAGLQVCSRFNLLATFPPHWPSCMIILYQLVYN